MSTYKSIKGTKIKEYSVDPITLPEGQMWFNSYTGKFKIYSNAPILAAWSTANNTPFVTEENGGFGTQTAAVFAGGYDTMTYSRSRFNTYHYDGNVYTASSSMSTDRGNLSAVGAGTQTAGLICGGYESTYTMDSTEEYNGSSWTYSGNIITGTYSHAMRGTQTAAVLTNIGNGTELYDGTSWTSGSSHIHSSFPNYDAAMGGTQTAMIQAGGGSVFFDFKTDSYLFDGTTWTSGPTRMLSRNTSGGFGTQTNFNLNGGFYDMGFAYLSELYDGMVWSTNVYQLNEHSRAPTAGSPSAGVSMGGNYGDGTGMYSWTEELDTTGGSVLTEL